MCSLLPLSQWSDGAVAQHSDLGVTTIDEHLTAVMKLLSSEAKERRDSRDFEAPIRLSGVFSINPVTISSSIPVCAKYP